MPSIAVTNLQKTFRSKRKAAGLGASLRSLARPEYQTVEAVRGLDQAQVGPIVAPGTYTVKLKPAGNGRIYLDAVLVDRDALVVREDGVFVWRVASGDKAKALELWKLYGWRRK